MLRIGNSIIRQLVCVSYSVCTGMKPQLDFKKWVNIRLVKLDWLSGLFAVKLVNECRVFIAVITPF